MLKNILKTLQETGDIVVEKASELNDAAKEKFQEAKEQTRDKVLSIIEEWVELLPKLMALGFEMTSFGISMSLSPCMLAELKGKTDDFSEERIKELLEIHKEDKSLKLFLNVIKTTFVLHKKTNAGMKDDLIVRVEVKLSPEIKVFIGQPQLT
ncbi:MAG: hypothetical protein KA270_03085 [Saprospiraceae bacterium]|jgi:hypothetical protein|nr:hypothetical protein [Saprospiraceae bacterium]MBP6238468.1 hypothetical protein [Saprospiraceae bacterium]MBP6566123.1 hypothetical protein [Saprospiraceae bacterium]MBP9196333.1 hypothetical protein [Saprospiraceae bacterium]